MFRTIYLLGALIFVSIYFSDIAEAGCNGSCEVIEGQDWTVELDTHIWNEQIEVKNLEVLSGASLKLENVTIQINEHVTLIGKTQWIESNITLLRQDISNNVTVHNELEIISSEVVIYFDRNNTASYGETNTEGIYLVSGSKLIIRDSDENPDTKNDASKIRPYGYGNPVYSWNTLASWEIMGDNSNSTLLNIRNSILTDIWQSRVYGDDSLVTNNHFIGTSDIFFYGDNLRYLNNTHDTTELNKSYVNSGAVRAYDGRDQIIDNNTFSNGNLAIDIERTTNITVSNNKFYNKSSNAIWAGAQSSRVYIYDNTFDKINTAAWVGTVETLIFENNTVINGTSSFTSYFAGSNISISNNNFSKCASSCLLHTNLGFEDNENINIYDNNFIDYPGSAIMLGTQSSTHNGISINNNRFENGGTGVLTNAWYLYAKLASNVVINENIFNNLTNGLELNLIGGDDFVINNNSITNVDYGAKVMGSSLFTQNLTFENNSILAKNNGILYLCSVSHTSLRGNLFKSNLIESISEESISLDNCRGEITFNNNTVKSPKTAIDLYSSDAAINDNTIIGNCLAEDCLRVSFSKVSEIGIKLNRDSEAEIISNSIVNFYTSVYTENSLSNTIIYNNINFTHTGIHSIGSDLVISENNFSNSYNAINLLNSEALIEGARFDTFDVGIQSFNSTVTVDQVILSNGNLCMSFTDTNYTILNYQNLNCIESILYEKYFVNFKIQTNDGDPSPQHQFNFATDLQNGAGFTNYTGFSDYYLITTKKIDNAGLTTNFNPLRVFYSHNGIENSIEIIIDRNQTIIAELDTLPPETRIYANDTMINSLEIFLNFEKISSKNDLESFDIYSLTNDGMNFAEWVFVGTYNKSIVKFEVENGFKYRFKSISRDIYGNIEYKQGYDFEVEIDTEPPKSFFEFINSEYYFANDDQVLIKIGSESDDVSKYELIIYYTNFTTSYLNPSSVVWSAVERQYFYDKGELVYNLSSEGHYGFSILATDNAGNIETKNKYDFIINYDPNSDTLLFTDVPERWGSERLDINLANSDFNLDFNLYLAMESINYENPYFTWYEHPTSTNNEIITIQGLLDKTRYYLYAESVDLAGNVEDPLNTTEYFSSSGQYDQIFTIKYIPLIMENYDFIVEIDNNLDGIYETTLALGNNLEKLDSNEFYVDKQNKTLHFGGIINGGFVPNQDIGNNNNIKITYSGVHAIFEVYTGNPEPAQNLEIIPTNTTHIIFEYNIPSNSDNCKVQRTTNISKGWFNQEILSPCLKGTYEYEHSNPDANSIYYYRILIEDEFGHVSISENRSVDMNDVVKIYNTGNTAQGDQSIDSVIVLTAIVGALMLAFGGVLLYRAKDKDTLEDNVTAIESKPVAKYKVEELYLIYKDGRLIRNISAVEVKTDSDIMSGMLTAINDFVQDSFKTEGDLGDIGYGNNKIVLQRGNNSYLAAVIYGEVDNYFKSKMINAVRSIESKNPSMVSWNGDSESIGKVKVSLKPIIDETSSVTREMVDNYFTEKDLVITTDSERIGDIINLKVNISNYSSSIIQKCRIKPEINTSILSIMGIEPDLAYHFNENSFNLGEIDSYNEVYLEIKLRAKKSEGTAVEIKMSYEMKGKEGDLSSVAQIN